MGKIRKASDKALRMLHTHEVTGSNPVRPTKALQLQGFFISCTGQLV